MVMVKKTYLKMEENLLSHSWEWFTSLIPWVTHGSELCLFFSDVNSPKVNASSLLYMGMIYVLFTDESKIQFKEKYINPPHV